MARVFKRKDRLSAMSEINITSLLDLVFCLLIIFMITTPLLEQTMPIKLPSEAHDPNLSPDPKSKYQSVSMDDAGQFYYGHDLVSADELLARLKTLAALPDPPTIDFRRPGAMITQKEEDFFHIFEKSGLTKLSLDEQAK